MRVLIALFLLSQPVFAGGRVCVENGAAHTHLFTTETRDGTRQTAMLAPGGQLCSAETSAQDGVIGVFETPDALEGCGRIIPAGTTETLIAYAEFDRCHWGAHDR
jgi:hypothetical protein